MSRPAGFTLVEMLVTLAVLGVLLGIASPLASSIGDGMRLMSITSTFLSQLHLARSEAIKRGSSVVVCKSPDGEACAEGGGWEQGWIVFNDRNNDGLRDPQELVIRHGSSLPPGFRLAGNLTVANSVSFHQTGATRSPSGAFQAGTLTACRRSVEATQGRQIIINAVGRPRLKKVELERCD